MLVSKVMQKTPVTASLDSSVCDILPLFFEKKLNSLPLLNSKRQLVGIVVREDVLRLLYPDYQEYVQDFVTSEKLDVFDKDFSEVLSKRTKNIMKKRVLTTTPDSSVMRALGRMIAHHIDQMPVVKENGKLIGMITKSDIFQALFKANKKRIYLCAIPKRNSKAR